MNDMAVSVPGMPYDILANENYALMLLLAAERLDSTHLHESVHALPSH